AAHDNQHAHHLNSLGVGPDVAVGVCLERGPPPVVALLGILKAGGCYLPLDPDYPTERLAFMLRDAKVSVLLTQSDLRSVLPEHDATVVALDHDWPVIAQHSQNTPSSQVGPDNLAYVIYTSGSTGT